jgi:hypothetical protein
LIFCNELLERRLEWVSGAKPLSGNADWLVEKNDNALGKDGSVMKNSKRLLILFMVAAILGCFCPLGIAMDEAQISQKFEAFEKAWLKNLSEKGPYGEKSMKVEKGAGGGNLYVAKYDILKDRAGRAIKKTSQPATPYIGVMRYEVWTCSAFGKTPEEAKAGKFECENTSQNREIFRFNGTEWVY